MNREDQKDLQEMGIGTRAIHAGQAPEPTTGAVMTPVFQTSTYAQPHPGAWDWEYSRTHNPTRTALQECIASLEGAKHGVCFSSGLAAIDTVIRTLEPGSWVLCGDDVYGGTYRLFTRNGPSTASSSRSSTRPGTSRCRRAPTWSGSRVRPTRCSRPRTLQRWWRRSCSGRKGRGRQHLRDAFQRLLELGADVVVHSTKYLNGHSDVVGGVVLTSDDALHERLCFLQNAVGAVPGLLPHAPWSEDPPSADGAHRPMPGPWSHGLRSGMTSGSCTTRDLEG